MRTKKGCYKLCGMAAGVGCRDEALTRLMKEGRDEALTRLMKEGRDEALTRLTEWCRDKALTRLMKEGRDEDLTRLTEEGRCGARQCNCLAYRNENGCAGCDTMLYNLRNLNY